MELFEVPYYQRGRVSNILKTFNHLNMNLDVDGMRTNQQNITSYKKVLDMRKADLTTTVHPILS